MASSLKKITKVEKYCEVDYFVGCTPADKRIADSKSNIKSKNSTIKIILNEFYSLSDRLTKVFRFITISHVVMILFRVF